MTSLYLDTFSGISGDMLLGLLVDLGVDLQAIREQLDHLPLAGYELAAATDQRHGIGGTRVTVDCQGSQPARTWADIDRMLAESRLAEPVKARSRAIFRRLGEAEARVHRVPLERVHFHEVGAVDAIVDIVGTAVGLDLLGVSEIICAPLPLAGGLTRGQHGALPLPAPATLELLKGQPVRGDYCARELVTPTGAAIAATVGSFGALPEMTVERIGYGVGGWQLDDHPNLLRGILGRRGHGAGGERDTVTLLETHLDDATPEALGYLLEQLLAAGALDVGYTPLQMKKNRPGTRVTVIAAPAESDRLARLLLRESSAIGVRLSACERLKLRRQALTVVTELGEAQVKLLHEGDTLLRITPEFDSCRALAQASGRPLAEVTRLVEQAGWRQVQGERPDPS